MIESLPVCFLALRRCPSTFYLHSDTKVFDENDIIICIFYRNSNRRRLNRHMNEINPQIQREISLIQERSRRMNIDPSLSSVSGLSLRTANPIHSLQTDFIQDVKPDIRNIPLQHLGGITTSISLPQENRQKLSLHERFSLL